LSQFTHLHVHTQYSLLDGAASINGLITKAKEDNMNSLAITDHGNMFGVFKFVNAANQNGLKPIIGCEFYLCGDHTDRKDRTRYHQLLLVKNATGYKNLCKLCSKGYLDGFYYFPRIDKKLLKEFKEGLIATTCCLVAEIPRTILDRGAEEAEELFKEWLDLFGEDYYVELQRHGIPDQDKVNTILLEWARKYNVKVIATNDSHYVNEDDWEAHDILLCLQTGKDINDPSRFKFDNNQFFFKTTAQMTSLFEDVPQAIENTQEIVSKIEPLNLKRDILLPAFSLPAGYASEDEYLKYLSFEGAKRRHGEVKQELTERLNYELGVIAEMGFSGYFLIVQDFVDAARQMKVAVGPGRGSAAGSAVAYCTGITNIDPVKYKLLFERFLNPERVSMPDIDIDFDDEGRQSVINYVVEKYSKDQVAQIITFGTMAAKSAIRDVARVLGLPLPEADKLAKLVPEVPGITLEQAFADVKELANVRDGKGSELAQKTLQFAQTLEGSARHTGVHAAGVIIASDDLIDHIPLSKVKDSDLCVSQYDGKVIEDAGMLKMDFLGLKTLSIIKDTLAEVKRNHDIKLEADEIPLDDQKTFELFQRGDTVGIFQFESRGMSNYLKELKPTNLEDLIAMNALYRPGPMDHIPEFIKRKHGHSQVSYPHPWLEEILRPTYGIMVYQEQIMQTAQIMAGYTLGAADILRRVMGKKDVKEMEKQKIIFISGAKKKGVHPEKAEEIFALMEKFAKYGFNRSHSAAYSVLAFQTAYLKAHYPADFMAAVLTHNRSDIKQINFFLNEATKQGILSLGPDINESLSKFTVNSSGEIRFALTAVKGVGSAAVEAILKEREANGDYLSIFDLTKRVSLRAVNKKCLESLVNAGTFDSFQNLHRAQYFHVLPSEDQSVLEKALRQGSSYQQTLVSSQNSLFGTAEVMEIEMPKVPDVEPWPKMELLKREKEVTGVYISGHPLDDYRLELANFCHRIEEMPNRKSKNTRIAGIVTKAEHRLSKKGNRFGLFSIEDYTGATELALFSEDYLKYRHFLVEGELLYLSGIYQLRFQSEDRFELKIKEVHLLSEVMVKLCSEIEFRFSLEAVKGEVVERIVKICDKNPGKCIVKIKITDTEKDYSVDLFSKSLKIALNDEVKKFLQELPGDAFRLN